MKKFLIGITIFVLVLTAGIFIGAYWVLQNPTQALNTILPRVLPSAMKITWDDFRIEVFQESDFEFGFAAIASNVQVHSPKIEIPIDSMQLWGYLRPFSKDHKRIQLFTLNATALRPLKIQLSAKKSEKGSSPFELLQTGVEWIQTFSPLLQSENVNIHLTSLQLISDNNTTAITAHLEKKEGDDSVAIQTTVSLPTVDENIIGVDGKIFAHRIETEEPALLGTIFYLGSAVNVSQEFTLTLPQDKARFVSSGGFSVRAGQNNIRIQPEIRLNMNPTRADFELTGTVRGMPSPIPVIRNAKIKIETPLTSGLLWSEQESKVEAQVPIPIFFVDKNMRRPLEESCACRLPEILLSRLSAKVWWSQLFSSPNEKLPLLDARVELDSVRNKMVSIDAALELKINKLNDELEFLPAINSKVVVHRFKGLKNFLIAKGVMIPAPLSAMDGTISLTALGPFNRQAEIFRFPVDIKTRLSQNRQHVDINAKSKVEISRDLRDIHLDADVRVARLHLNLPPMDPTGGRIRVFPDNRILTEPKVPEGVGPVNFTVNVRVQTEHTTAIRLYLDKYFKPYLPVSLKVRHASSEGTSGVVRLEPFEIEYLRRKISVERMQVDLSQPKDMPINGRFKVEQSQYTVFVDVNGPLKKPQITFSSSPYLPEAEVISVLLYDRTSDQMVSAEAETVGGVQAAVADRAIGIFGIWLFASTPIRNFYYNPTTQVYAATVAISDDTNFGVGTNLERATQVELRKWLSRRWLLTAFWIPASQEEEQTTKVVLQWEKRFD